MAKVTVKLKGVGPLLKQLKNSSKIIQQDGTDAIDRTLKIVQGASVPLTPVDTGRLYGSYQTFIRPLAGILKVDTEYAGFVHEGTRFMKGRPFLLKGFNKSKSRIENIWKELGNKIVKDLARK